jgi:hypothetical protein
VCFPNSAFYVSIHVQINDVVGAIYVQMNELLENSTDVGLVVIDGICDFVSSINSEEESTKIADFLLQITAPKNIHVITVLHQNKDSEKMRGQLGTELLIKADTVAVVTKHKTAKE